MRFKPLTLTLCLTYFCSQVAFVHAAETSFWAMRRKRLEIPRPKALSILSQKPISVHSDLLGQSVQSIRPADGSVREVYRNQQTKNAPIVLIQDVHLNEEAQRNIADIMTSLNRVSKKELVIGVEGAFGPFDFSDFRAFNNKQLLQDVADHFLNKKEIAAPSYVGLTTETPLVLYGVEEKKDYDANVAAYKSALAQKEKVTNHLSRLKQNLEQQKQATLNSRLRQLDQSMVDHQNKVLSFPNYVLNLLEFHQLSKSQKRIPPAVRDFAKAYKIEESLNFDKVESERKRILQKLTTRLTQSELELMWAQGVAFKEGKISFADYYREIKGKLTEHNVSLDKTPSFDEYLQYVLLADQMNGDVLFDAISDLEKSLISQLSNTKKEEDLMAQSRLYHLASQLTKFSLTPKEWDEYREQKEKSINSVNLKSFEAFYEEADKRSYSLVENLTAVSHKEDAVTAMLVGGFHTPLITNILKEQGLSYAVVQPNLTLVEEESGPAYLSVFSREKTPLDRLFEGEKLFMAPSHTALGTISIGAFARRLVLLLSALTHALNKPLPILTGFRTSIDDNAVVTTNYRGQQHHAARVDGNWSDDYEAVGQADQVKGYPAIQYLIKKSRPFILNTNVLAITAMLLLPGQVSFFNFVLWRLAFLAVVLVHEAGHQWGYGQLSTQGWRIPFIVLSSLNRHSVAQLFGTLLAGTEIINAKARTQENLSNQQIRAAALAGPLMNVVLILSAMALFQIEPFRPFMLMLMIANLAALVISRRDLLVARNPALFQGALGMSEDVPSGVFSASLSSSRDFTVDTRLIFTNAEKEGYGRNGKTDVSLAMDYALKGVLRREVAKAGFLKTTIPSNGKTEIDPNDEFDALFIEMGRDVKQFNSYVIKLINLYWKFNFEIKILEKAWGLEIPGLSGEVNSTFNKIRGASRGGDIEKFLENAINSNWPKGPSEGATKTAYEIHGLYKKAVSLGIRSGQFFAAMGGEVKVKPEEALMQVSLFLSKRTDPEVIKRKNFESLGEVSGDLNLALFPVYFGSNSLQSKISFEPEIKGEFDFLGKSLISSLNEEDAKAYRNVLSELTSPSYSQTERIYQIRQLFTILAAHTGVAADKNGIVDKASVPIRIDLWLAQRDDGIEGMVQRVAHMDLLLKATESLEGEITYEDNMGKEFTKWVKFNPDRLAVLFDFIYANEGDVGTLTGSSRIKRIALAAKDGGFDSVVSTIKSILNEIKGGFYRSRDGDFLYDEAIAPIEPLSAQPVVPSVAPAPKAQPQAKLDSVSPTPAVLFDPESILPKEGQRAKDKVMELTQEQETALRQEAARLGYDDAHIEKAGVGGYIALNALSYVAGFYQVLRALEKLGGSREVLVPIFKEILDLDLEASSSTSSLFMINFRQAVLSLANEEDLQYPGKSIASIAAMFKDNQATAKLKEALMRSPTFNLRLFLEPIADRLMIEAGVTEEEVLFRRDLRSSVKDNDTFKESLAQYDATNPDNPILKRVQKYRALRSALRKLQRVAPWTRATKSEEKIRKHFIKYAEKPAQYIVNLAIIKLSIIGDNINGGALEDIFNDKFIEQYKNAFRNFENAKNHEALVRAIVHVGLVMPPSRMGSIGDGLKKQLRAALRDWFNFDEKGWSKDELKTAINSVKTMDSDFYFSFEDRAEQAQELVEHFDGFSGKRAPKLVLPETRKRAEALAERLGLIAPGETLSENWVIAFAVVLEFPKTFTLNPIILWNFYRGHFEKGGYKDTAFNRVVLGIGLVSLVAAQIFVFVYVYLTFGEAITNSYALVGVSLAAAALTNLVWHALLDKALDVAPRFLMPLLARLLLSSKQRELLRLYKQSKANGEFNAALFRQKLEEAALLASPQAQKIFTASKVVDEKSAQERLVELDLFGEAETFTSVDRVMASSADQVQGRSLTVMGVSGRYLTRNLEQIQSSKNINDVVIVLVPAEAVSIDTTRYRADNILVIPYDGTMQLSPQFLNKLASRYGVPSWSAIDAFFSGQSPPSRMLEWQLNRYRKTHNIPLNYYAILEATLAAMPVAATQLRKTKTFKIFLLQV